MSQVQFVPSDHKEKTIITAEMIQTCDDIETLQQWRDGFIEIVDDIEAQFEARKIAETDDDDWAYSATTALTLSKMGIKRTTKRLKALGQRDTRDATIRRLEVRLGDVKTKEARWRLDRKFVELAETDLDAAIFGKLMAAASRQMASEVVPIESEAEA